MQYILEPYGGVWLVTWFLILFFVFNYALSWAFGKNYVSTKEQYLVANRELGLWQAGLSVGASYIWAPAMFISAAKAYSEGWVALFYFIGGNTVALLTYTLLVNKICNQWKDGFTLSDFMGVQHSKRVQNVYWVSHIGLSIGAFATQLLAGAMFIKLLTGMNYTVSTVLLAIIPLLYSIFFGFKSSVITDLTKMVLLSVIAIGTAGLIINGVGWSTVINGVNGYSGQFTSLFNANGWLVFSTFGLATFVGLLSGPFGDQALWQRAFAVKKPRVRRNAFLLGTVFFLTVPISMALIGFAAAGSKFTTDFPGYINVMFIIDQLPIWVVMLFGIMVLAGITSILDSKLSAVSSIAGHDIARRFWKEPTDRQSIRAGKLSMLILCGVSVAIANIPGITLIHLFLIYGALRASTMMPTLLVMLRNKPLAEPGVFYGCIGSIIFGVPTLAYGALNSSPWATVTGSLGSVLISGIISLAWTFYQNKQGIVHQYKIN